MVLASIGDAEGLPSDDHTVIPAARDFRYDTEIIETVGTSSWELRRHADLAWRKGRLSSRAVRLVELLELVEEIDGKQTSRLRSAEEALHFFLSSRFFFRYP